VHLLPVVDFIAAVAIVTVFCVFRIRKALAVAAILVLLFLGIWYGRHLHWDWDSVSQLLPDVSAYFLAAVGAMLPFMTELSAVLERRTKTRLTLAAVLFLLGVSGIVSNRQQRKQDRDDRLILVGQIRLLIAASTVQATSDDIKKLDTDISEGFSRLEAAIRGKAINPITRQNPLGPALPANIKIIQKRAPSTDPNAIFGLQIILQTDTMIKPTGFRLYFDGPIEHAGFFLAGQSVYTDVDEVTSGDKKWYAFGFKSPEFSPTSPIVITVASKANVRVIRVEQVNFP
jgi:hypothetical protein